MQISLGMSLSGALGRKRSKEFAQFWRDYPDVSSVLPPSYVLVDQETDLYPNDYTGESNANVLRADDGNEVSATASVPTVDTYWILAGWCESNLAFQGLPASSGGHYFLQSHVNNQVDFTNYVTNYGEITSSNTPTISSGSKIVIRMKYSGDAPVFILTQTGYFNHTQQSSENFSITSSFADYEIDPFSRTSSTIDFTKGFYLRLNIATMGTTTLHIDRIAVIKD